MLPVRIFSDISYAVAASALMMPPFALLSSANRDETIFEDSERLNIARNPNRHLGFGLGIHFCLGAPLARMEGCIVFNKLLARFPKIRLAVPRAEIHWRASPVFRGLKSLPVYLE